VHATAIVERISVFFKRLSCILLKTFLVTQFVC